MKLYIRAATVEYLRNEVGKDLPDDVFEDLVRLDPTSDYDHDKSGKYWRWTFGQYKLGNLEGVDYQNLRDDLGYFSKANKKFKYPDLSRYKSVQEFMEDAEDVANRPLTEEEKARQLKRQAHAPSDSDKKFLVQDDEWEVWQPLTRAGSISLSREGGDKARWCTAAEGDNDYYWRRYTREGPLYIFINKDDRTEKYQTHFESHSYMYNKNDRSMGETFFYKFMADHPIIADYFNIDVDVSGGVIIKDGAVFAFLDDTKSYVIPDGVKKLNKSVPSDTVEVYLPDSITELGSSTFSYCNCLEKVRLPNGIKSLPEGLFQRCYSLKEIVVPDSVTRYGDHCFDDCRSLTSIKHSASLKYIGNYCFDDCRELKEMDLPDSIRHLGEYCFNGTGITSLVLPPSLTELRNPLGDILSSTLDLSHIKVIGSDVFRGCKSFVNLDLTSVETIGAAAFADCESLESVKFGPNVTIGFNAFMNDSKLKRVKIGPNMTLKRDAFDGCTELTVQWDKEDEDYEFNDIKLLTCDESCTQLINANQGIVKIKTRQGEVYAV